MRLLLIPACTALASCPFPALAQDSAIDPGDLPDVFIGNWTVRGEEHIFRESCRLLTPNSFVICEGAITDEEEPYQWVSLMGYSHFDDLFNYTEYGGDGSIFEFEGWYDDGVWTFVSHRQYEQRVVRIEDRRTPTTDGYVTRRRISINGGDWETRYEEERVRLPD